MPFGAVRIISAYMLPSLEKIICHLQSKGFLEVNLQPTPTQPPLFLSFFLSFFLSLSLVLSLSLPHSLFSL